MEDRLHKFTVLVESRTFTAAAKELHISQPALSVAIHKLESELHTTLFVHGIRSLTLTDAGRLVYRTAKEIDSHIDRLDLRLRELASTELNVHLGMIDSIATILFTDNSIVAALEEEATLSLIVDNTRALLPAVEKGELDLAFVTEPVLATSSAIMLHHVVNEPLVLVGRPEMVTYISGGRISHFISYDQASMTFRLVLDGLRSHGLEPAISFSSTSPEVMLRLVLLGRGPAVLPYLLVRDYVQNGELVFLDGPVVIPRGIAAAERRGSILPKALRRVTAYVRKELTTLNSEVTDSVNRIATERIVP